MTLYERAGGFDAILALCRHWHALCSADPLAGHPFEHITLPNHDERLAAYLSEALGGPPLYTAGYGDETFMQRLHAGNGDHPDLYEACLVRFDRALSDVGVPQPAAEEISAYFRAATTAMHAYSESVDQVPDRLPFNYA
ncbi:oxidoreductase [Nocardioides sp. CER19]|uniref:truncated hemoglobin n=1 Tax=Nocardioides sp. CER19 TaxID=3038538 RepID=UPI00244B76A7|nr:oxidoreductase [Nocardioides sp. CER19]MDH2414977.1 oxidoreductase [Nocardioides sp. CER19]